jgi:hypothetical protein
LGVVVVTPYVEELLKILVPDLLLVLEQDVELHKCVGFDEMSKFGELTGGILVQSSVWCLVRAEMEAQRFQGLEKGWLGYYISTV